MKKIKSYSQRIKSKKIYQGLFIIPIILIILVLAITVNAGEKDSTLVRSVSDKGYAVAPLADKTHLYNFELYFINSITTYCLEIGKKITTDVYNSTDNLNEQLSITKLNKNQLNYIKEIAYFGYSYPYQYEYKYYMAAQEMIWEYLNPGVDITWSSTLDINGPKINLNDYKEVIATRIKTYDKDISFKTITGKIGSTITLKDTNSVLPYYEILSSSHHQIEIDNKNSTLKINFSDNYIGKDKIILKRKENYSNPVKVYYFENSQKLLSAGKLESKTQEINLNIEGQALTTELVDKDTLTNTPSPQASLASAKYEVYDKDKKYVTSFTTDEAGKNTIPNLYHEKYYIKQIKASKGYKLNNELYEIDLTSTNNKITLTEEVIKSDIEINKLYEVSGEYKREANIKFNIYDNKDCLYTTLVTTSFGTDKITLPYGEYTIKQENTTYGYNKVSDIKIIINEDSNPIIRYDLVDKKITTKLQITTMNLSTKSIIAEKNIKYKIKDLSTNKYVSYLKADNTKTTTFSTDNSGKVIIPVSLSYGEYQIEQINPPKHYLKNENSTLLTINDKSEYFYQNDEVVLNVDFYNKPIVGKINISTTKEELNPKNSNLLNIIPRKNIEVKIYHDNKIIKTTKTSEDGTLILDNLNLGKYCIKEGRNEECFELVNKDNQTEVIEKNIEFREKIIRGNVTIKNIDNNNESVPNSIIDIYKDTDVIDTKTTDKDGQIKLSNLKKGKYCVIQRKVADKYILNTEKICFEINDDNKDVKINILNSLNNQKIIKIPNTLSNDYSYLIIVIILLIISGVGLYKKIPFITKRH